MPHAQISSPPCDASIDQSIVDIETFQGIAIKRDRHGYYGAQGADDFGYTTTLDELKEEIARYWGEDLRSPMNGHFAMVSA